MKVVHLTSVHPVNDNRIFYKECKTLLLNGFEVILVVAGEKNRIINGITIIGYEKEKNRIKRIFKTSFLDMIKICKKIDANIFHFHDPELIFVGFYLKLKGKKVIYDIHENNPGSILTKPYIKSKFIRIILAKLFDIFEKMSINFFDALITARPDITKRFKHNNIITLKNYPILPDLSKVKRININKQKPSIIYVGVMSEIRGISQLVDTFNNLNDIELWLLGPIRGDNLKQKIHSSKNVKYLGIVEATDIFSYINLADAGIITFLPAPNHINSLPTKPFEYMACGKPIIMSNFEYWKETFQNCAIYVNPEDPKDIERGIRELFSNRKRMEYMSELNLKLSLEKYNWNKEEKKLLTIYKKVLDD